MGGINKKLLLQKYFPDSRKNYFAQVAVQLVVTPEISFTEYEIERELELLPLKVPIPLIVYGNPQEEVEAVIV